MFVCFVLMNVEPSNFTQGRPGSCGNPVPLDSEMWRSKKKHVFALSVAGKPIYSRYGHEDELVTIFGVMQAMVSFVKDDDDSLRCLIAGKRFLRLAVRYRVLAG